jgi:hypothetical protein
MLDTQILIWKTAFSCFSGWQGKIIFHFSFSGEKLVAGQV